MAKELSKHSVPHRLITIRGGEHGLGGGNPDEINAAYDAALEFVNQHMTETSTVQ